MRKAIGLVLILVGIGLWFLPPTLESLPAQYSRLGTILHWSGPVIALLGLVLLFSGKKVAQQAQKQHPT